MYFLHYEQKICVCVFCPYPQAFYSLNAFHLFLLLFSFINFGYVAAWIDGRAAGTHMFDVVDKTQSVVTVTMASGRIVDIVIRGKMKSLFPCH